MFTQLIALSLALPALVNAHACPWHPSMWGYNYTAIDGNRPQDPLQDRNFNEWWFHNHLAYPPHAQDFLEFPAGGSTKVEITCDKAASNYWRQHKFGEMKNPDDSVCPGQPMSQYHTNGLWDLKGTGFAIAYIPPSQVNTIRPEDFTMFTINNTSPWKRTTIYKVPARMPACPPGGCTCAWFWIHSSLSGSQQIYMNGFQCKITGATSTVPLAQPQIARRCGEDNFDDRKKPADPKNCTYGAKAPIYWKQNKGQGNTFFEDPWHAPYYNSLYAWKDGGQDDIFVDSVLPEMSWPGAPKTGQLKAARGTFPSGSSNGGTVTPQNPAQPPPASTPPSTPPVASNPPATKPPTSPPVNAAPPPSAPPATNSSSKPPSTPPQGQAQNPQNWWVYWWLWFQGQQKAAQKSKVTQSYKVKAKPKLPKHYRRSAEPEAEPVVPVGHRRSRVMKF